MAIWALLAVLYALLAVGLLRAAPAIDGGSRATRTIRIALATDLGALACIFVIGLLRSFHGGLLETAAGVAFLLLFLLAAILGGMTLRRSELRMPALLHLARVVIIPPSSWSRSGSRTGPIPPAEAALYLGLALLGTRQIALLPARPGPRQPSVMCYAPGPVRVKYCTSAMAGR
jgi:hypothetical protein